MWELIAGFIGLIGGIAGVILKDAFFKGRQSAVVKAMDGRLIDAGISIKDILFKIRELEKQIEAHTERFKSITRDHSHLEDSLEKLNDSMKENSLTMNETGSTLSELRATLSGLQELIQNIIAGNLKIRV